MAIMKRRVMIWRNDLNNERMKQMQGVDCQGGMTHGIVQGVGHG